DDFVVVAIDLVVEPANQPCQVRIQVDESVKALADHRRGEVGHALELVGHHDCRQACQVLGALGNVLGQIAHAFQVGVDLEGSRDAAQVHGHRLMEGQQL